MNKKLGFLMGSLMAMVWIWGCCSPQYVPPPVAVPPPPPAVAPAPPVVTPPPPAPKPQVVPEEVPSKKLKKRVIKEQEE